jgi:hypothetical protein
MILTILISVVLSVIITLGLAYGGFVWYNRKLEAQAKEATQELTRILKEQMSQDQNDYVNKLHNGNSKGFLQ